jgi:hypothetical protein
MSQLRTPATTRSILRAGLALGSLLFVTACAPLQLALAINSALPIPLKIVEERTF